MAKKYIKEKFMLIGLTGLVSLGAANIIWNKTSREVLYNRVSKEADIDREDGMTTQKEWAQVYNELELHFDTYTSNPRKDLSVEQMRQYLINHQLSTNVLLK